MPFYPTEGTTEGMATGTAEEVVPMSPQHPGLRHVVTGSVQLNAQQMKQARDQVVENRGAKKK